MSPYVWFGLAMLAIVVVSLVLTGNLAARFNERAKAELGSALDPLAELLGGSKDIDAARVDGRYGGQIVSAQLVSGPGGMGRLFRTTMIEPAGGEAWSAVVRRPREETASWERTFEGNDTVAAAIRPAVHERLDTLLPFPGWFELAYDPQAGALRLTRAMQSRRDIPTIDRFVKYLETLAAIADTNCEVQEGQGTGAGAAADSGASV